MNNKVKAWIAVGMALSAIPLWFLAYSFGNIFDRTSEVNGVPVLTVHILSVQRNGCVHRLKQFVCVKGASE